MDDSAFRFRKPAIAAMAAAACLVPVIAVGDRASFLVPVAALLAIGAFWAVGRALGTSEKGSGAVGTRLMIFGGGLFAALGLLMYGTFLATGNNPEKVYPGWLFIGFPIGGVAFAAGLVFFAVAATRAGLPRAPFILMGLFLPTGLAIDALGAEGGMGVGGNIGFGMLALGLFWLGVHLWSGGREPRHVSAL